MGQNAITDAGRVLRRQKKAPREEQEPKTTGSQNTLVFPASSVRPIAAVLPIQRLSSVGNLVRCCNAYVATPRMGWPSWAMVLPLYDISSGQFLL